MPRILKFGSAKEPAATVTTVDENRLSDETHSCLDPTAGDQPAAIDTPASQAMYAQRLRRVVEQVECQLDEVRDVWRQRWEQDAIRLACRIAARCLRDLPFDSTELARTLVAESLRGVRLDASCEVRLHPDDYQALTQDQQLSAHEVVLLPDSNVEPGGCVVRTPEGVIDQQLSSQLSRVEDELTRI